MSVLNAASVGIVLPSEVIISKLKSLGWNPVANFDLELEKIVEYNKNHFIW